MKLSTVLSVSINNITIGVISKTLLEGATSSPLFIREYTDINAWILSKIESVSGVKESIEENNREMIKIVFYPSD